MAQTSSPPGEFLNQSSWPLLTAVFLLGALQQPGGPRLEGSASPNEARLEWPEIPRVAVWVSPVIISFGSFSCPNIHV